jgi:hypothetical protein
MIAEGGADLFPKEIPNLSNRVCHGDKLGGKPGFGLALTTLKRLEARIRFDLTLFHSDDFVANTP